MKKRLNFETALGLMLATLAFLLAFKNVLDIDLWWHLATGRWIVENRQFINQDVFSYTYHGAPWMDITWAYEVVIYGLYSAIHDYWLITGLMALLAGVTVWVAWKIREKLQPDTSPLALFLGFFIFALVFSLLDLRWIDRPEQLTHFYGIVFLYLLLDDWQRYRRGEGSSAKLWCLPLLQVLWVNTHGMFLMGPAIVGLFAGTKLLDSRWPKGRETTSAKRSKGGATDSESRATLPKNLLWQVTAATFFVCLLNPRGWAGATFPIHLWEVLNHPFYRNTIPEATNPLKDGVFQFDSWAFILFSVASIASLAFPFDRETFRQKIKNYSPAYFILTFVLIRFSILARRNIQVFALWMLPWVAAYLSTEILKRWTPPKSVRERSSVLAWAGASALGFIFAVAIVTNYYRSESAAVRFGGSIAPHEHPEGAANFIRRLPQPPKFFTAVHLADYAIFAVPGFQDYIDGRFAEVYPREHFQHFMDILAHPPLIDSEVEKYSLNGVALEVRNPMVQSLIHYLSDQPQWKLGFFDETAVVFLKTSLVEQWKKGGFVLKDIPEQEEERLQELSPDSGASIWDILNVHRRSDSALAITRLGETILLLGELSMAANAFQTAFILEPDFPPALALNCIDEFSALQGKAAELQNSGKTEELNQLVQQSAPKVEKDCSLAVDKSSDKTASLMTLGALHLNLGNPERAVAELRDVVQRDPLSYQGHLFLGRAAASLGTVEGLEESQAHYLEAGRLRPRDGAAFFELGKIMQSAGRKDLAAQYLEEANERQGPRPSIPDLGQKN